MLFYSRAKRGHKKTLVGKHSVLETLKQKYKKKQWFYCSFFHVQNVGTKNTGKQRVLATFKQKYQKKAMILLLFCSRAKRGHKKVILALVLFVF